MNGLLASLRFPFALRGLWAATAAVPAAFPVRAVDAATLAPDSFRTLVRPEAASGAFGTHVAPRTARPAVVVEPAPEVTAPAPLPAMPIEPSVRVSPAHLVDPVGLRVVPFRPSTRWPLRRAAPRIYDPFRGFPQRSLHLADLMDDRTTAR